MTWVYLVVYGWMHTILLYKVIGVIRVMDLHLGVSDRRDDMVDSAYDCVHGVSANVGCSDGSGGDTYMHIAMHAMHICVQTCTDCII